MQLKLGLFCSSPSPGLILQRNIFILEISLVSVPHMIWGHDFQRPLLKKTGSCREDCSLRVKGSRTDRSQGAGIEVVSAVVDLSVFGWNNCYCLSRSSLWRWMVDGVAAELLFYFLRLLLLPLGLEHFLKALGIWSCLDSGGWRRDLRHGVRVHLFQQPLVKMILGGVPK